MKAGFNIYHNDARSTLGADGVDIAIVSNYHTMNHVAMHYTKSSWGIYLSDSDVAIFKIKPKPCQTQS